MIDKFFVLFVICFLLYLIYYYKQPTIVAFLQRYYPLWVVYVHVQSQIAGRTLLGLFYASFSSSLFFVMLPIEVLFIYYSALPYSLVWVVGITLLGNLFGLVVNYVIGRIIGVHFVKRMLKERFERFHNMTVKYGAWIIFLGNTLIFPIELITLVVGAAKYPFRRFVVLSALGKMVKFFLLIIGKEYLITHVLPRMVTIL